MFTACLRCTPSPAEVGDIFCSGGASPKVRGGLWSGTVLYWTQEETHVLEVSEVQERKCPMPVGIEDFGELIQREYYFVDKTRFIRELLDSQGKITLGPAPVASEKLCRFLCSNTFSHWRTRRKTGNSSVGWTSSGQGRSTWGSRAPGPWYSLR